MRSCDSLSLSNEGGIVRGTNSVKRRVKDERVPPSKKRKFPAADAVSRVLAGDAAPRRLATASLRTFQSQISNVRLSFQRGLTRVCQRQRLRNRCDEVMLWNLTDPYLEAALTRYTMPIPVSTLIWWLSARLLNNDGEFCLDL